MECWKFDCLELPAVPGGYRAGLTSGIAKYLGIPFELAGDARERAMLTYPEAFCRLVRACAEEARAMMREGVPPFDEARDYVKRTGDERCHVPPNRPIKAVVSINIGGDIDAHCFQLSKTEAQKLIAQLSDAARGKESTAMNDIEKRLEAALVQTVERLAKESTTAAEVEALAAVAKVLADMQRS